MMAQEFAIPKNQKNMDFAKKITSEYKKAFSNVTTWDFDAAVEAYKADGGIFFPYPSEIKKRIEKRVVNLFDWNKVGYCGK